MRNHSLFDKIDLHLIRVLHTVLTERSVSRAAIRLGMHQPAVSAALKRRFNYIHIPVVSDQKTEVEIVRTRCAELLERYKIPGRIEDPVLKLLTTVFREMRQGATAEGLSVQKPTTTLSTAEAIGVALDSAIHSRYFGSGSVGPEDIARNLIGSIVKEDLADLKVLKEYMNLVAKKRAASDPAWKTFYEAAVKVLSA